MPTTRTVTVKPSGGDYASLSAALVAEAGNLVSLDRLLVIECYAMVDTVNASDGGFTTDATHYITITAPAGQRHSGVRDNSKYLLQASAPFGAPLFLTSGYTRVYGLQVHNTGTSGKGVDVHSLGNQMADTLVYDCASDGIYFSATSTLEMANCGVLHNGGAGIERAGADGSLYAFGCTIMGNGGVGISGDTAFGRITSVKNTYSGGNGGADYNDTSLVTSYSEDGSASSPTAAYSTSSGARFTNVTPGSEDIHIGLGSALIGAGTDLHADGSWVEPGGSVDIEGDPRSAPWDVGADQVGGVVYDETPTGGSSASGSAADYFSQIIRPTSDVAAGSWAPSTGSSLYATIDEITADDADYIQSSASPGSPDLCKVRLPASPTGVPATPRGDGTHRVNYRYLKDTSSGDRIDLTVRLYRANGTTVVAEESHADIGASIVAGTLILTGTEADSIPDADYATGLVLGFEAVKV